MEERKIPNYVLLVKGHARSHVIDQIDLSQYNKNNLLSILERSMWLLTHRDSQLFIMFLLC